VPYIYHTACQFRKLVHIIWKLLAFHVRYSKEFWLRLHFYMWIIIFCEMYIKRNMCLLEKQKYEVTEAVSNTEYMKDTTDYWSYNKSVSELQKHDDGSNTLTK